MQRANDILLIPWWDGGKRWGCVNGWNGLGLYVNLDFSLIWSECLSWRLAGLLEVRHEKKGLEVADSTREGFWVLLNSKGFFFAIWWVFLVICYNSGKLAWFLFKVRPLFLFFTLLFSEFPWSIYLLRSETFDWRHKESPSKVLKFVYFILLIIYGDNRWNSA